ncbi:hypothetical protein GCM10022288_15100 [Gryllotalpicola kribbensis]|uniref:DUF4190 domain-containing protein n=1 Tax=Gryllotalpicola kribbensis TaxID=993084 RepID=A0ABP8ARQ9_9MICO
MSTPNEPHEAPAPGAAPAPAPAAGTYYSAQPVVDRAQLPPFNVMALITFIGAFIIPVVGIVCGHITLAEYRKGLPERGREYAKAGLILGYIFTALWLVLIVVWIVFAFTHFGGASDGVYRQGGFGGNRNFPIPTPRVTPYGGQGN